MIKKEIPEYHLIVHGFRGRGDKVELETGQLLERLSEEGSPPLIKYIGHAICSGERGRVLKVCDQNGFSPRLNTCMLTGFVRVSSRW